MEITDRMYKTTGKIYLLVKKMSHNKTKNK